MKRMPQMTRVEEHVLSNRDLEVLTSVACLFDQKDFYSTPADQDTELTSVLTSHISPDFKLRLQELGSGIGPDVLVFRNVPRDDPLPSCPTLDAKVEKKSRKSETFLSALTILMGGTLQCERTSHQPGYLQQIHPVEGFGPESSGRGAAPLPFHVENVFIKEAPSFLALACLSGQEGVATELLGVPEILTHLAPAVVETLQRPIFTIRSGDGFSATELTDVPAIENHGGGWVQARFYEEDRMLTSDEDGKKAIRALKDAIGVAKKTHTVAIELQAGMTVLLSNGVGWGQPGGVLHGRTGKIVPPASEQGQRWLQRACIKIPYCTISPDASLQELEAVQ